MIKASEAVACALALVTTLVSAPTWAQAQTSTPTTTAIAAAPATSEATKPAQPHKTKRWLKADARVCLEFPNDMQVIKCSEKYR